MSRKMAICEFLREEFPNKNANYSYIILNSFFATMYDEQTKERRLQKCKAIWMNFKGEEKC